MQTAEPIIGASVVEKGTIKGIGNRHGWQFSLNVKVGTTLQITFVGYQPQDVKATKSMKGCPERGQRITR